MREHRTAGRPAGASEQEDSGEGLGRGNPRGARARLQRCGSCGTPDRNEASRPRKAVTPAAMLDAADQRRGGRDPGDRVPLIGRRASKGRDASGERRVSAKVDPRRETGRTPGSAAGCNKPAKPCAEQAAEVGRNDKGGTCSGVATPNLGQPREDAHDDADGGAIFEELQERNPKRPQLRLRSDEGRRANRCTFEGEGTGPR